MPVTVAPFRSARDHASGSAVSLSVEDDGTARTGRLTFSGGAAGVRVGAGARAGELVSLDARGREPRVRAWEGDVDVQMPSFVEMLLAGWSFAGRSFAGWPLVGGPLVPTSLCVGLSSRVPWSIECRGGASEIDADLRGLELASLAVHGGCASLVLALPRPRGVVPVELLGGLARAFVMRPAGVPLRVSVSGGACAVRFDGHLVGPAAGRACWESDDWDGASGYDVRIAGGVADLVLHEGGPALGRAWTASHAGATPPPQAGPYRGADGAGAEGSAPSIA